jgi:hypothetical protein
MKNQLEITEAMRSADKITAAKSYIKTLGVKVLSTHGIGPPMRVEFRRFRRCKAL